MIFTVEDKNNFQAAVNCWVCEQPLNGDSVRDHDHLTDVFENFRKVCLEFYKIDPCHLCTAPGLAWQACLRMTGVKQELLTDIDMHLFIEKGIRGGVAMMSHRFASANNPHLPNYDPNGPNSFIMYCHAINLGHVTGSPDPGFFLDYRKC
ncbi:hypothetical protein AVEN_218726-1 [Araneus ventricosus]|uniref:Uncharacterized protein n=1 Tax=Araneus ventricosus TaxID=182803 RepID=A0A4Y2B4U6_ARAVE|nr:hypothetical protein AVEN_218726-1 [Araneus ventricosus]